MKDPVSSPDLLDEWIFFTVTNVDLGSASAALTWRAVKDG